MNVTRLMVVALMAILAMVAVPMPLSQLSTPRLSVVAAQVVAAKVAILVQMPLSQLSPHHLVCSGGSLGAGAGVEDSSMSYCRDMTDVVRHIKFVLCDITFQLYLIIHWFLFVLDVLTG